MQGQERRTRAAIPTTKELPDVKSTYEAPVLETLSLKATHDIGIGIGIDLGLGS